MGDALIGALVGGLLTAAVSFYGWKKAENESVRRNKADYRKAQIDEFYGPLLGYIKYSRAIYTIAKKKLPTKIDLDGIENIDPSKFTQLEKGIHQSEIWDYFNREYFIEVNANIARLINEKRHYAETQNTKDLIEEFLEHETQGNCLHNLWVTLKESSDEIQNDGWPANFEMHVTNEFQELKDEYRKLSGV